MKSVFKLSSSRWALLAAFGFAAAGYTPAAAADLGGDCCADLEERVAELEATTARKGNRKVSLTISGWVNEAINFWDDGSESNVYVGTNKLEQTRIRFVGEAQIAPGYSAGYTLELGSVDADSSNWNQNTPDGTGANTIAVRKSNWWLKSKDYGKVTIGEEGTATYHLLDDADAANTRNFADYQAAGEELGGFFLKSGGSTIGAKSLGGSTANLTWGNVLHGVDNNSVGQNGRRNIIRYDSPTIAGFTVTASWGEDDEAGASVTYTGTWGDFKVIGKGGWEQSTDEDLTGCSPYQAVNGGQQSCEWFGGGASVMHVPTGLYVYGGYGELVDANAKNALAFNNTPHPNAEDTSTSWFIQGGIEQKWIPLGTTTIFGEYRHDDSGSKTSITLGSGNGYYHDGSFDFAGAGIVQNIAPAAMDLYVLYRHGDGDINFKNGPTTTSADLDSFDMFIAGALIKF
jgi:predicted porin